MPRFGFASSFFLLFATLIARGAFGTVLRLSDYLQQVERSDPGYRGLVQESEGAKATSAKADLLFRPQFYSQLQFIDNTLNTQAPLIQGTSTIKRNASVGIREQTPYGLGVQISFDVNQSVLFNTDPRYVTYPDLTNTYIDPEFNISLWQNFLGRADRANKKVAEAQELANAYGKAYQAKASLVEAESRYWKLAVAREAARVQKESLDRARAILEFDSKKAKRHLIDPSDLLLARASVKGKELELRSMLDEERSSARAFNSSRGIDSDDVEEELSLPKPETLGKLQAPKRDEHRGDVQAAEQTAIAQSAGSEMAREKLLPELSLYGSVFAYGLNFTVPLDVWTTSSVREGYARQAAAADLAYQRKLMDEQSEWKDLAQKFSEAKEKLAVAMELEDIQRAKFENVRRRRARGLTVEDQVFEYELDYLNSALARVQIEGAILGLHAQMRLYGSER